MDSTNSTSYRPQSPDLSFLSSPSKKKQPYQPQPISQIPSYAPRSPDLSNFTEYNNNQYMPPIPALPTAHAFNNHNINNNYTSNQYAQFLHPQPQQQIHRNLLLKTESSAYSDHAAEYTPSPTMSSRGPRIKSDPSLSSSSSHPQTYKNPNPTNIEIKTKFPVARIKRIMQADEEVGKVAQVTPVAVSKALELFMIALVGGAAEKAREKGGKKVTAQHLKQVVMGSPEQFDFLAEIVGRISEAQEGAGGEGKKRKEKERVEGSESSEEEKKPKKGRGRKKKSDD